MIIRYFQLEGLHGGSKNSLNGFLQIEHEIRPEILFTKMELSIFKFITTAIFCSYFFNINLVTLLDEYF